jgi:hypothetical protein
MSTSAMIEPGKQALKRRYGKVGERIKVLIVIIEKHRIETNFSVPLRRGFNNHTPRALALLV